MSIEYGIQIRVPKKIKEIVEHLWLREGFGISCEEVYRDIIKCWLSEHGYLDADKR